jgi:hypothetical protein
MKPSEIIYGLHREVTAPFARHVLGNAMLHVGGWWNSLYTRSPLPNFFCLEGE